VCDELGGTWGGDRTPPAAFPEGARTQVQHPLRKGTIQGTLTTPCPSTQFDIANMGGLPYTYWP